MLPAILAFDTSLDACSVALRSSKGEIICEQRCEPRAHAKILLPMIDTLLARVEIQLNELDAVAFARGPGSFTGVRMAASVAQGLAFGAQLPVIAISSLATLAQACAEKSTSQVIVPLLDARMGEVYAGFYTLQEHLVVAQHADCLLKPQALLTHLAKYFPDCSISAVGSGWPLVERHRLQIDFYDAAALTSAQDLLLLAEQSWQDGATVAPDQALPVYLRDSSAWQKIPVIDR